MRGASGARRRAISIVYRASTVSADILAGGGSATVDLYFDEGATIGLVVTPNAIAGGVTFQLVGGGAGNSVLFSSIGLSEANITLLKSISSISYTSGATLAMSSISVNQISAIPEPSAFAAILGVFVFAGVVSSRRLSVKTR